MLHAYRVYKLFGVIELLASRDEQVWTIFSGRLPDSFKFRSIANTVHGIGMMIKIRHTAKPPPFSGST